MTNYLGSVISQKSLQALAQAYRVAAAVNPKSVNHPKPLQQK
jgi:hypothetical protein